MYYAMHYEVNCGVCHKNTITINKNEEYLVRMGFTHYPQLFSIIRPNLVDGNPESALFESI